MPARWLGAPRTPTFRKPFSFGFAMPLRFVAPVRRFAFVRPALSADVATRRTLFERLRQVENRRQESWVLDAVALMNHPLRAAEAIPQIRPSLELVEEIQQTGDIFFPLRWMNATLDGHQSPEAAAIVERFLAEHPDYPPRLRGKMLQAADGLMRAARIVR